MRKPVSVNRCKAHKKNGEQCDKLETLLAEGMQVWPDISAEELESLKLVVKTGNYLPILVSADRHRMYDGHQRCLALLALGRKTIPADKVLVMSHVTERNIWDEAIAMQSIGRQLSSNDKAQAMHRAYARGKSQRQIARAFRISQSAVSQLMSAYPADDTSPAPSEYTKGDDDKVYPRKPVDRKPKEDRVWAIDGMGSKMVRRLRKMLKDEIPSGLQEYEKAALAEDLESLGGAVQATIDYMETM